jgi:hypothetical protein
MELLITEIKGDSMEYDLKAMDLEIKAIEEKTKRLKELARGFEAVEKNAEAILTFVYLLRKNVSDIVE